MVQAVAQYGPCIARNIMLNDGYLSSTIAAVSPEANQDLRNEITQMPLWSAKNTNYFMYKFIYTQLVMW